MHPAESTSFVHDGVTMTEYQNEPFIVGDYNHNNVEFMHLSHQKWYTASPFPHKNKVFGYAVVSRPGAVYLFGGCCNLYDSYSMTVRVLTKQNLRNVYFATLQYREIFY